MEGKISNNYDEVNQKIDNLIQNLLKLKDELNNNKDNVKKYISYNRICKNINKNIK